MTVQGLANRLGALALGLSDRIRKTTDVASGHGGESSAALAAIGLEPGISNDGLRRVLALSHSGTVRLIDKLAADALVERRPARDGRAVALHLTDLGVERREFLLRKRSDTVDRALAMLDGSEQLALDALLGKLLTALPANDEDVWSICRLCDFARCEGCPFH